MFISRHHSSRRTYTKRRAVIRGFENMVNKKKFKYSVHTVLKKIGRRHTKLEISLPMHY